MSTAITILDYTNSFLLDLSVCIVCTGNLDGVFLVVVSIFHYFFAFDFVVVVVDFFVACDYDAFTPVCGLVNVMRFQIDFQWIGTLFGVHWICMNFIRFERMEIL